MLVEIKKLFQTQLKYLVCMVLILTIYFETITTVAIVCSESLFIDNFFEIISNNSSFVSAIAAYVDSNSFVCLIPHSFNYDILMSKKSDSSANF